MSIVNLDNQLFIVIISNRSCSMILVLENVQVYFDQCSICLNERNTNLKRSFSNISNFRQPVHLILNNIRRSAQICSTPSLSRFSKNKESFLFFTITE